jgi:4-hydroxybenzoate polyprenyltransferase
MAAVLLWVAGFDILYSCQDLEFDRAHRLYSIPAKVGAHGARALAVVLHLLAIGSLIWFGQLFALGSWYRVGMGVFTVFLASQHITVHRHGFSSINQVFLTRNGIASVVLFVFAMLDTLWR